MPGTLPFTVDHRLADICRRYHIRKLALFGSVLTDSFRPDSDVDVLVAFEPGAVIGLDVMDLEQELAEVFGGRKIDLVNEKYLNPRLRDGVLREAQVQYAEG